MKSVWAKGSVPCFSALFPRPTPSSPPREAGAQAVGVQVFPGQETFQAVGVALHQNVQGRSGQGESPAQVNFARSGHKHDAERGQGQGYGGAHVLFKKNQGKRNAEDKAGHHKTPPERGGAVPVQSQPVGQGHHHAELGAFAGLELHADGDPAAFPVDFLPDAGHHSTSRKQAPPRIHQIYFLHIR